MRSGGSFRDFVIFYSKALFLYPVSLSFVRWKTHYSSALVLDLVCYILLISLVYCVPLKGQLPPNYHFFLKDILKDIFTLLFM